VTPPLHLESILEPKTFDLPGFMASKYAFDWVNLCGLRPVMFKMSDIRWASRWDTYLQMMDDQIHWWGRCNLTHSLKGAWFQALSHQVKWLAVRLVQPASSYTSPWSV
jgi:hypothetical protein